MNNVIDFINTNRDRYVDELKEYLAIPSISALPQHQSDVRRCAEWTADEIRAALRFAVDDHFGVQADRGEIEEEVPVHFGDGKIDHGSLGEGCDGLVEVSHRRHDDKG